MTYLESNLQGFALWLTFTFCSVLILLLCSSSSEASMYHRKGTCTYKDKFFKPGESFRRGCDKCFCHDFGFYCFTPMKPTSWPKKCHRVWVGCGYKVIYKEMPLVECHPYSWIG